MTILRINDVKRESGHRSSASIYNAIRAGLFTAPVRIGIRSVGWPAGEVAVINAARIAGRTDDQVRELVRSLHTARAAAAVGDGESSVSEFRERSARAKACARRAQGAQLAAV